MEKMCAIDGENTVMNYTSQNDNIATTQVFWTNPEEEPPPLNEEVREAIKGLKNDKRPGDDEITAEMINKGGKHTMNFFRKLCSKIWTEKKWQVDWVNSVFVPVHKKGGTFQCCNNRTIALICHSSKILLNIIANRMKKHLEAEI